MFLDFSCRNMDRNIYKIETGNRSPAQFDHDLTLRGKDKPNGRTESRFVKYCNLQ